MFVGLQRAVSVNVYIKPKVLHPNGLAPKKINLIPLLHTEWATHSQRSQWEKNHSILRQVVKWICFYFTALFQLMEEAEGDSE